tara:strand:- start:474 stop:902 length:429 start_codon:yes stop_codon:yes gene_type:complete
MARKTARKSRKSRRRSRRSRRHKGGHRDLANAAEVNFGSEEPATEVPAGEEPVAEAQEGGKRKRRRRKSRKSKKGGAHPITGAPMTGGKRKRKTRKGGKRKLNAFFKAMLDAKKTKAKSFQYKGKTYVGKAHKRLGMIYSKK